MTNVALLDAGFLRLLCALPDAGFLRLLCTELCAGTGRQLSRAILERKYEENIKMMRYRREKRNKNLQGIPHWEKIDGWSFGILRNAVASYLFWSTRREAENTSESQNDEKIFFK